MSVAQQSFVFVFNIAKLKLQRVSVLNPYWYDVGHFFFKGN